MGKALILGKDTKHLDKDIELCRTTKKRLPWAALPGFVPVRGNAPGYVARTAAARCLSGRFPPGHPVSSAAGRPSPETVSSAHRQWTGSTGQTARNSDPSGNGSAP